MKAIALALLLVAVGGIGAVRYADAPRISRPQYRLVDSRKDWVDFEPCVRWTRPLSCEDVVKAVLK